jgi:membrane protease YdiL (CAAX protease family)
VPVVESIPADEGNRTEGPEAHRRRATMHQFFLLASIALIAAYWSACATLYANDVILASIEHVSDLVRYTAVFILVETALVWALLRGSGECLADLGLSIAAIRDASRTQQVYGAAVLLMMTQPFIAAIFALTGIDPGRNSFLGSMTTENLPAWVLLSVFGGGFREELERAFCLTRFERGFGTPGLVVAMVVDAVLFGRGHWNQGTIGMISAAVMGLGYSLVFLRRRRVADAMIAHAFMDLMIVLPLSIAH